MKVLARVFSVVAVALVLLGGTSAQSRRQKPVPPAKRPEPGLSVQATEARTNLIAATMSYKQSLEKVLELQQKNETRAAGNLSKQREMLEAGIVSRRKVEEAEKALADLGARAAEVVKQIEEADHLIVEVVAEEQLAKTQTNRGSSASLQRGVVLVRYAGTARWSLNDYAGLDQFFRNKFARSMPVSAFGQTGVHDRLGFAHHAAVDVALHPDSVEGRALMAQLQLRGIPFLAFRAAVAGSATGAHIHVGPPSHRFGSR